VVTEGGSRQRIPRDDAVELLDRSREPRLVVLDEDGQTLPGLGCFNQGSASFCAR